MVKLWQWRSSGSSNGSGGGPRARTYSSKELATFGGHPEEVYALLFIPRPGAGRSGGGGGSSGGGGGSSGGSGSSGGGGGATECGSEWLVAGSGESLFLWDLAVGRMVHEAMPPRRQRQRGSGGSGGGGRSNGVGAAPHGAGSGSEQGQGSEEEGGDEEGFPPYVFAMAVQPAQLAAPGGCQAGRLLATACCDGAARLWSLGAAHLEFVGEVQVRAVRLAVWVAGVHSAL